MDCIFCNIIKGNIPSYTIYEDEIAKVFLDINPSTNGDLLVIPKKHIKNLLDMDNDTLMHLYDVIKTLMPALQKKLKCDGFTLVQNNDYGQEIKHFHIHLTPRYENDGLKHQFDQKALRSLDEVFAMMK